METRDTRIQIALGLLRQGMDLGKMMGCGKPVRGLGIIEAGEGQERNQEERLKHRGIWLEQYGDVAQPGAGVGETGGGPRVHTVESAGNRPLKVAITESDS